MSIDAPLEHSPGILARIFGDAAPGVSSLADEVLTLATIHGPMTLVAADVLDDVACLGGLLWSRLRFETPQGTVEIRGLSREAASVWLARLSEWQRPARVAALESARRHLIAAFEQAASVEMTGSWIRCSELERLMRELRDAIERVGKTRWSAWGTKEDIDLLESVKALEGSLVERVRAANERCVATESARHRALFDSIEEHPLTERQRRACVVVDDNNLVLAGAGSGKTSVVIARVGYLAASGAVRPAEVLVVAYNTLAAEELRDRMQARLASWMDASAVTVRTFHALGLEIVGAVEGEKPALTDLEDPARLATFVSREIDRLLLDSKYLHDFVDYGFDHAEPFQTQFDFKNMADYEKFIDGSTLRTLDGFTVRSLEELRIANWLLRQGIQFKYEAEYPFRERVPTRRAYQPDFTITIAGDPPKDVYLEHFGLDENGKPPPWMDERRCREYLDAVEYKRDLHKRRGTVLLETHSHQFRTGEVFEVLKAQLSAVGVTFAPRTNEDCLRDLRESGFVNEAGRFFATLLVRARDSGADPNSDAPPVRAGASVDARSELLWRLLRPVLRAYEAHLQESRRIDFAGMIDRATAYVRSGAYESPFTHLLVDEFQDISESRAALVRALRDSQPGSVLFCVGDDWQSIYRFAGSDVRFTSEFESRIGPGSVVALDQTFRMNDKLSEFAGKFVSRNPFQRSKVIAATRRAPGPAVSLVPTADIADGVKRVLARISRWAERRQERFLVRVLGRYGYELESTGLAPNQQHRLAWVDVILSTVHSVKGKEADFVILIGLSDGRNGFPAEKPRDPFHELFLPEEDAFPNAEERRLFYVAVTRARHRVYLLYDTYHPSRFVLEVAGGDYLVARGEISGGRTQRDSEFVPCGWCATGHLGVREANDRAFVGCSRWPRCDYKERGCPRCGGVLLRIGEYRVCSEPWCDGIHPTCPECGAPMDEKNGPRGSFFGCSNFGRTDPRLHCQGTRPLFELPTAASVRSPRQVTESATADEIAAL